MIIPGIKPNSCRTKSAVEHVIIASGMKYRNLEGFNVESGSIFESTIVAENLVLSTKKNISTAEIAIRKDEVN